MLIIATTNSTEAKTSICERNSARAATGICHNDTPCVGVILYRGYL